MLVLVEAVAVALRRSIGTHLFSGCLGGGVSLFGVAILEDLMDRHEFQSRYLDKDQKTHKGQAPYYRAENIKSPCLLLQGLENRVVPPDQAREMEAIKGNGVDVR